MTHALENGEKDINTHGNKDRYKELESFSNYFNNPLSTFSIPILEFLHIF